MSKNKLIYTFIALLILVSSCSLDKYPASAIEQTQAFSTLKDATTLRNGLYNLLRASSGGQFIYITDYQSDLLHATLDYGNRGGIIYRWEFLDSDYNLRDMWQINYQLISNINNFLDNVDKIKTTSSADAATLTNYIGEAYLMRALAYHRLVIRFAKDYEPSTAEANLGLPLVLHYAPNDKPSRATLKQTYDQIVSDLAQAKLKLTTVGAANSYYLTADAVTALEARVALYMHDWTTAVTKANTIIANYPLIDNSTAFETMWKNDTGSEIIMKTFMSTNELAGQMNVYINYSTGSLKNIPDFVPEQWVVNLYASNDIRKSSYLVQAPIVIQSQTYTTAYMINKYQGNPSLFTTAISNYYQMIKLFRSAEAHLIKAEAAYRNNQPDVAVAALNVLRNKRGLASLSTSLTGAPLFSAIKEERTREMLCEGTRLDDLKRWGDGFSRGPAQFSAMVLTGSTTESLTVAASDMRFVWEIPANDLTTNKNLVKNWQ